MRARFVLCLTSLSFVLGACGDGETATVVSTTTVEDTRGDAGGSELTAPEQMASPEEFCVTDEAIDLKLADKKMMDVSYGQLEASNGSPDPAKVEPLFNRVIEIASHAPAGASCVAQPLFDAEGVASSDFVPNGTARLKEVAKELQRHGLG